MANLVFNRGKKEIMDGTIDLLTDVIKIMLVTATYAPNPDDLFATTPAVNELSGTGYVSGFAGAGRKTLVNKVIAVDNINDRAEFDNTADLTWTAISAGTMGAFVIYKHLTSDAASVLIAYNDSGGSVVTNGGDLTIQFNAEGLIHLT